MAADAVGEAQLRDLIPGVLAALVHRGADFTTAEDAVQEALVRAVETWPNQRPDDPKGWLITTAWRRFVDLTRSDTARHRREQRVSDEPSPGPTASADDTLEKVIGVIAIAFGTINIVGGFMVTDRMLGMFSGRGRKQKKEPESSTNRVAPDGAPSDQPGEAGQ